MNLCLAEPRTGLVFKSPKNGKTRTLAADKQLLTILHAHRDAQAHEKQTLGESYEDQGLVFALATGSPVTPWNFAAAFRDLVVRAKVTSITLHDVRHTHASLLAKAGIPLEVVSKRLGHSSITITANTYLHMYPERDRAAATAFGALLEAV